MENNNDIFLNSVIKNISSANIVNIDLGSETDMNTHQYTIPANILNNLNALGPFSVPETSINMKNMLEKEDNLSIDKSSFTSLNGYTNILCLKNTMALDSLTIENVQMQGKINIIYLYNVQKGGPYTFNCSFNGQEEISKIQQKSVQEEQEEKIDTDTLFEYIFSHFSSFANSILDTKLKIDYNATLIDLSDVTTKPINTIGSREPNDKLIFVKNYSSVNNLNIEYAGNSLLLILQNVNSPISIVNHLTHSKYHKLKTDNFNQNILSKQELKDQSCAICSSNSEQQVVTVAEQNQSCDCSSQKESIFNPLTIVLIVLIAFLLIYILFFSFAPSSNKSIDEPAIVADQQI
jgi:hypothetical protein